MTVDRPLLLACTEVYDGPWTPTGDLEGYICAEGLVDGEDEIVISIRDLEELVPDTVLTMQRDAEIHLGGVEKALIRAQRTRSSGSEVHVWVS